MKKNSKFRILLPYLMVLFCTFSSVSFFLYLRYNKSIHKMSFFIVRNFSSSVPEVAKVPFINFLPKDDSEILYTFFNTIVVEDKLYNKSVCHYTIIPFHGSIRSVNMRKKSQEVFVGYSDSSFYTQRYNKLIRNSSCVSKSVVLEGISRVAKIVMLGGDDALILSEKEIGKRSLVFYQCRYRNDTLKKYGEGVLFESSNNYHDFSQKVLACDGIFFDAFGYVTYTCLHLPYIYVFDKRGRYIKRIETLDHVPFPSIIEYNNVFVFERGKTYNSNVSSFAHKDKLYVFSYRVQLNKNKYVIDTYDLKTGQYIDSRYVDSECHKTNRDIDCLINVGKIITIKSGGEYTSFSISSIR
jgi:hypothetical protein